MLPRQMNLSSLALLKYSISKLITITYNLKKKCRGLWLIFFKEVRNALLFVRFRGYIFCLLSNLNAVQRRNFFS